MYSDNDSSSTSEVGSRSGESRSESSSHLVGEGGGGFKWI